MGTTSSTPTVAATRGSSRSPRANSQILVEKLTPRSFSVVADTIEETLEVLCRQIKAKMQTEEVQVEKTVNEEYLLGVNGVYFIVDILKQSNNGKYQASVTIKI